MQNAKRIGTFSFTFAFLCGKIFCMKRILLKVQFLGTNYCGWQAQPKLPTIQSELERAIFETTGEHVRCESSGRTDAGVHALSMPVMFDSDTRIMPNNIYKALNAHLPNDIKVISSGEVDSTFHARFDVKEKTYAYYFYVCPNELPYYQTTMAQVTPPFDFNLAKSVCPHFKGKHDWVGFASSKTEVSSTVRTIKKISLSALGENKFCLRVTGDGFLYNMVRIIAGTIIEVGQGKIDPNLVPEIIESKDRSRAGKTAQAVGLVLEDVQY